MITIATIPGIHCAACEKLIRSVSDDVPGIQSMKVDLAAKTVSIEHDATFNSASWIAALSDLGEKYAVADMHDAA